MNSHDTNTFGADARLIALDWGTSSLRAWLLGRGGAVLDTCAAPLGVQQVPEGDFAGVYARLTAAWRTAAPGLPALAAGMIGSAQGWCEAPYQVCPADAGALGTGLVAVDTGCGGTLHIVPGLRVEAALPDVMRGEETQILGALAVEPALAANARLVLPGTHSKWVTVRDGRIERFATYMTGELFAVLRAHSILGRPAREAGATSDAAAFARGVASVRDAADGLFPLLFSARTLVLRGALDAAHSLDYLSGLLIGEELRCALAGAATPAPVLIGDPVLCERYLRALALFGVTAARSLDNTAPAGLWRIAVAAGLVTDTPAAEPSRC